MLNLKKMIVCVFFDDLRVRFQSGMLQFMIGDVILFKRFTSPYERAVHNLHNYLMEVRILEYMIKGNPPPKKKTIDEKTTKIKINSK